MGLSGYTVGCLNWHIMGKSFNEITADDIFAIDHPKEVTRLGPKTGAEIARKLVELGYDISGTEWESYIAKKSRGKTSQSIG